MLIYGYTKAIGMTFAILSFFGKMTVKSILFITTARGSEIINRISLRSLHDIKS